MSNEATPADAKRYAKDAPTEFLKCRLGLHDMDPYTANEYRLNGLVFTRSTELCSRCKAVYRHREYSKSGKVLASWYSPVPGTEYYNTPGRLTGEARDLLRLEYMKRAFPTVIVRRADEVPRPHKGTRDFLGLPHGRAATLRELLRGEEDANG
jgi:hypothetical protein